jgi:Galactose oxidase, central domain/Immunoglobulin domain/PQQ-like domain/Kelch motif
VPTAFGTRRRAVLPLALLVAAAALAAPSPAIAAAWVPTGSLNTARMSAGAVLLQNGKVLIIAGALTTQNTTELYDPATGAWTPAAPLPIGRAEFTATLLRDGRVLVAGGDFTPQETADCRIYDPVSGTWSPTGSLNVARGHHTATLLPDGRVLVTGGGNSALNSFATAEVWNPGTGSWTLTGLMSQGHMQHSATLLRNGKVLIAGGYTATVVLTAVSEVFDPGTNSFTLTTGPLNVARRRHVATLLPDGRVLAAAGPGLASAELYDPGAGTWTLTGSLVETRAQATATLLPNGKVLVAGGQSGPVRSSVETYDPGLGQWLPTPSMAGARLAHQAVLLPNGRVLVAGGGNTGPIATAELFDADVGAWAATTSMTHQREGPTATAMVTGTVLVVGGDPVVPDPPERFDPSISAWAPTPATSFPRHRHTATSLVSGHVLVAGSIVDSAAAKTAELYDPFLDTWTRVGDLTDGRNNHTATLLPCGRVLVAGGRDLTGPLASAELYDPRSRTWRPTGSLAGARFQHTATLLPNGRVLVTGGRNLTVALFSAEVYDPATGAWSSAGSMASDRYLHTATLLPSGKVLVAGQKDSGPGPSAEIYDPASGTWTVTGSMVVPRRAHSATLLPNGKVLVAGGLAAPTGAELYDPARGTWSATAGLGRSRNFPAAALLTDGKVLVVGVDFGGTDAEKYDVGRGEIVGWKPFVNTLVPSALVDGQPVVVSGVLFQGVSEASAGSGGRNSSTNYPLAQLRRLDDESVRWLLPDPADAWSDALFRSLPLAGLVPGPAYVTVFTNGIPSLSRTLVAECPSPFITLPPTSQTVCEGASVTFTAASSGDCPTYEWRKNGTPLVDGGHYSGTATPMLVVSNADASDVGSYDMGVTLACSSGGALTAAATLTVVPNLLSVVATPAGSTSVCQATGCTAGTVTESHTGGGTLAHQWGFRTLSGGPISDIPGATSASYLITGTDFPGPGTYFLVVRTVPQCGPATVSNEVPITVTSLTPPDTVRHLTVTSKDQKNVLHWLNPPGFGNVTIRYRSGPTSCVFPSDPLGGDGSFLAGNESGAPNQPDSFSHEPLTNDNRYCYTVWVDKGGSVYSAGRSNRGRPFSTGGLVKWSFNLGIFAMSAPGNGSGVVHMVANDNTVHSAVKGDGATGGHWPTSPGLWIPQSMDGPSQGRPSGVNVLVGTAQPAIVLSSQDGHVYAFDAETGAPGWAPSSPALGPSVTAHPSGVFTAFGGSRDLVFVGAPGAGGSRFYALRLSDGDFSSPGWLFAGGGGLGVIGPILGQAAVDQVGKRVFFASRAFDGSNLNTVWCVDLETGAGLWAFPFGNIGTGVTYSNDRLYFGTETGEVMAVDTSAGNEGDVAWSFTIPALEGNLKGHVVVDRLTGDAFFSTLGRVWALLSDGSPKWLPSGDRPLASPSTPVYAPGGAWVYVGGGDGQLHRFSASTGNEDLIAPFPVSLGAGGAAGSPTFDLPANFLYVGTEEGIVYALRLP